MGSVVQVNVAVTQMIEEQSDFLQETVLNAIRGGRNISKAILDGSTNGFNSSVKDYYRYGEKSFVEGLPGYSTFTDNAITKDTEAEVKSIIEAIEGEPIRMVEYDVRKRDLLYLAKEFLQNDPGQDWQSDRQVLVVAGLRYKPTRAEFLPANGNLRIYLKRDLSDNRSYDTDFTNIYVDSTVTFKASSETYYHAAYYVLSDPYHGWKYWNYQYALGTYPALDLGNVEILGSTFLPIAPIRRNKTNVLDDKTYNAKQKDSCKKLLDKIGVDLKDMTDNLIDHEGGQDPDDIDNIDEIFVMFAADVRSIEPITLAYMFEQFRTYHYNQASNQQTWVNWWNGGQVGYRPKNAIRISDSTVSMNMEWAFTTMAVRNGLVSGIHAAPNPLTVIPDYPVVPYSPAGNDDIKRVTVTGTDFSDEDNENDQWNTHSLIYRRQLTTVADGDPSDTFEEILVYGLVTVYDVYRGEADGRGWFTRDLLTWDDGGFIMPVSKDIVDSFAGYDQTAIYYETIVTVVYAVQIQHLAWYQSGVFKILITIVLIGIAIYFQQYELIAAIEAGIWATALYVFEAWLVGYLITKGLGFLVEIIGGDAALILAAAIAVYATTYGDTKVFGKLLTASDMLAMTSTLANQVSLAYRDDFMQEQEDHADFLKNAQEKQEEIDAANDLLNNGAKLEMYEQVDQVLNNDPYINPKDYYNIALLNNPGPLTLEGPSNFVGVALTLPQLT